jgi:hypothetical protein
VLRRLFSRLFSRTTLRRLLALVVVAVAAVWSFDALTNLANFLGFGRLSWMFPLCIDAVAAIGMDYWMTRAPAWRAGRAMAMTAIGVSTIGNAIDWVLRDVHPLAPVFGIVPPIALAWVMGIMHRNARGIEDLAAWLAAEQSWREQTQAEEDRRRTERAERRQARVPEPPTRPQRIEQRNVTELSPVPERKALPPAKQLAKLREFTAQEGRPPTKREAMEMLGIGSDKALKLTRTIRETVTTETVETEGESA